MISESSVIHDERRSEEAVASGSPDFERALRPMLLLRDRNGDVKPLCDLDGVIELEELLGNGDTRQVSLGSRSLP